MEQDGGDVDPPLTLAEVMDEVLQLVGAEEGDELDPLTSALLHLAVRASATTLDLRGVERYLQRVLDAGGTGRQVQELLVLVSGVGLHTLLATAEVVGRELRSRGDHLMTVPLDERQRAVLPTDADAREHRVATVAPDFLENLVRLSPPATVNAVLTFRAAPWVGDELSELQRELVGIVVDATTSHRFLPTLRLHVHRAQELGAGQRAIRQVLEIAASAPPHRGVR